MGTPSNAKAYIEICYTHKREKLRITYRRKEAFDFRGQVGNIGCVDGGMNVVEPGQLTRKICVQMTMTINPLDTNAYANETNTTKNEQKALTCFNRHHTKLPHGSCDYTTFEIAHWIRSTGGFVNCYTRNDKRRASCGPIIKCAAWKKASRALCWNPFWLRSSAGVGVLTLKSARGRHREQFANA